MKYAYARYRFEKSESRSIKALLNVEHGNLISLSSISPLYRVFIHHLLISLGSHYQPEDVSNSKCYTFHQQLAEELTEEYGIPEDASAKISASYLKLFRKCPDNATCTLDAWRTILWGKALGERYSYLATKIYERWLDLRYHYLALAPDVIAMLRQLRKEYLLGLITNGPSNAQWEKVRRLCLEQYFDIILVSGDLPWEKPEGEIFWKACQFLNVKPDSCIMIGDKLETDILGGMEAGLAGTVWIPTADKPRLLADDPKPDFTIRYITDLLTILNRGPSAPELEDSSSNASDGSL